MSIRWRSIVAWAFSVSALWAILTPGVLSSTGLMWVSLAALMVLVVLLTASKRITRTVAEVIADVEAEPVLAVATQARRDSGERGPSAKT